MARSIIMNPAHLTLIPRMTEKTYAQSQNGTYVFNVPTSANQQAAAAAVAAQYGVRVIEVRTVIAKGKLKRTFRGGKQSIGRRNDVKKAYVTLVEGDRLKIFDAIEE